jgi:hypothetical protein
MCLLALVCTMVACGGDDSGEGEEVPEPMSVEISADDGGEIETQGASINIPGGALGDDTEVTLEVILPTDQPEAEKLVSLIYDFGPDGTTFEKPVELTIELNKTLPEGMDAKMAWLDEDADKWVPLEDSEVDGTTVTATTTHFTMFAIVLTAAGQTGGMCDAFEEWDACGGDVEGTWEFSLGCANVGDGLADAFGECPGLVATIGLDVSGTVTFEDDGTYAMDLTREAQIELALPTSCLMGGTMCSDYADFSDGASAELDGDVCNISFGEPAEAAEQMGTFELEGSTLALMDSEATEPADFDEYCVEGNTITVRFVDVDEETGEEQVAFIQATRQ